MILSHLYNCSTVGRVLSSGGRGGGGGSSPPPPPPPPPKKEREKEEKTRRERREREREMVVGEGEHNYIGASDQYSPLVHDFNDFIK